MSFFGGGSSSSSSSSSAPQTPRVDSSALVDGIRREFAVATAQNLIEVRNTNIRADRKTINTNCFERCVSSPSSALSSSEQVYRLCATANCRLVYRGVWTDTWRHGIQYPKHTSPESPKNQPQQTSPPAASATRHTPPPQPHIHPHRIIKDASIIESNIYATL